MAKKVQPVEEPTGPAVAEPTTPPAAAPEEPTLEGFQEAASYASVPEDVCAKLLKEWPVDKIGITRALKNAGFTGDLIEAAEKILRLRPTTAAPTPAAAISTPNASALLSVLPQVPEDTAFTEMLREGGVLKAPKTDILSAMRVAVANKAGLDRVADALLEEMKRFADAQDEPYTANYYRLRRMLTRRRYSEIFAAAEEDEKVTPTITEEQRREMIRRLNEYLWPALEGFHGRLNAWTQSWQGSANPMVALMAMAMMQAGSGTPMPPGILMQPPDTGPLRDESESVIRRVNKVFSGPGVVVARAMAMDAMRIKEVLEDPTLPAAIGATTKEMMLRQLGMGVGADFPRLERSVVQYALSIFELSTVPVGNAEYSYLAAMLQLGAAIPWDKLTGSTPSSTKEEPRPAKGGRFLSANSGLEL